MKNVNKKRRKNLYFCSSYKNERKPGNYIWNFSEKRWDYFSQDI